MGNTTETITIPAGHVYYSAQAEVQLEALRQRDIAAGLAGDLVREIDRARRRLIIVSYTESATVGTVLRTRVEWRHWTDAPEFLIEVLMNDEGGVPRVVMIQDPRRVQSHS